jgi:hypothetical protein
VSLCSVQWRHYGDTRSSFRQRALESLVITGYGAGFGAGIGIGIDALVRGRTRIYPVLSGRSTGAMISSSWH